MASFHRKRDRKTPREIKFHIKDNVIEFYMRSPRSDHWGPNKEYYKDLGLNGYSRIDAMDAYRRDYQCQ